MFFLVDEDVSFPASFPIVFQSGVNMNEAVRQPIELLYPHKYRSVFPFSSSRPALRYGQQTANL